MRRGTGTAVVTLVLVALAGAIFYEVFLGFSRGPGVAWAQIAEGALVGLAVLAVWSACRDVRATGVSLVVLIALVAVGMRSTIVPLWGFAGSPLAWALVAALLVRLVTVLVAGRPAGGRDGVG